MPLPYTSLDVTHTEIRLLALQPDLWYHSTVRGSLLVVPLDDAPDFEALSYVWGDPTITQDITIDDEVIPVTKNLEAALRRLRYAHETRVLWVDAVCINQADTQEKNTQVPLMAKIYTVSSVVVWLGDSNPAVELAMSWAAYLHHKDHKADSSTISDLPIMRFWKDSEGFSSGATDNSLQTLTEEQRRRMRNLTVANAMYGWVDMFHLPYWNRMWTYQELCLPQKDPVLYYGDIQVPASAILDKENRIANALRAESSSGPPDIARLKAQASGRRLDEATKFYIHQMEKLISKGAAGLFGDGTSGIYNWGASLASAVTTRSVFGIGKQQSSICNLLMMTARRASFDPRDRIYGLYGLLPDLQKAFPVDYAKAPETVLLETMAWSLNTEHSAFLFSMYALRKSRFSDTMYPSWVPDFDAPHVFNDPVLYRRLDRNAGSMLQLQGAQHVPPSVSPDLGTLFLWAWSLGPCTVLLHFAGTPREVVLQVQRLLIPLTETSPKLVRRVARACVSHVGGHEKFDSEELYVTYGVMFADESTLQRQRQQQPLSECQLLVLKSAEHLNGHSLFGLGDGSVGVGPEGVAEGDIVTFPPFAQGPILLRHEDASGGDETAAYFRMVGSAYVDGVSDGEFRDEELIARVGNGFTQEFLIH